MCRYTKRRGCGERRRTRGAPGPGPNPGPRGGCPPRVLLDPSLPAPAGGWFQLDLLETAPGRPPRIHGWWTRHGAAPLDGRLSLYLDYEITPDGVAARISADVPGRPGAHRQIAAFDGLAHADWSSALAPVLSGHPCLNHREAPGPAPYPRWARAAWAYLLTH